MGLNELNICGEPWKEREARLAKASEAVNRYREARGDARIHIMGIERIRHIMSDVLAVAESVAADIEMDLQFATPFIKHWQGV